MPRRNVFLLRFNGRNDNLGDQFIFRALVASLTPFGVVQIRGGVPDFAAVTRSSIGGWKLGLLLAMMKLRGYSIYNFDPPGARLWTGANNASRSGLKWLTGVARDMFGGSRIAIGTSVIAAADHSWCDNASWVGVRDQASLLALRSAGVKHADYFPDLAFLAPARTTDDVRRSGIGLTFRRTIPEGIDRQCYELQLSEALTVLAHSFRADETTSARLYHQVDEDANFNDVLSVRTGFSRHYEKLTLNSFEAFYRSAQIVVSNRLHGLLLGAYCGAVPVALTSRKHTKLTALFETVGWASLILYVENPHELVDKFTVIRKDLANLGKMVEASFEHQRRLGFSILEKRFGAIER